MKLVTLENGFVLNMCLCDFILLLVCTYIISHNQVCTTLTSITTQNMLEMNADTVYCGITKAEEDVRTHILEAFFDPLQEKTWTNRERVAFLKELKALAEK